MQINIRVVPLLVGTGTTITGFGTACWYCKFRK